MNTARDYNAELSGIAARVSDYDSSLVVQGQRAKAAPLQRLSNAFLLLRYVVERGDVLPRAPLGLRILYGKIVESVGCIHMLLKSGMPGPAAQIFRGALETCIHLHVILKDPDRAVERSTLFEEYLIVQRYRRRDREGVTAEKRVLVEVEFERVRGDYHPTHPFSWAWKICPSSKSRKGIPNNPDLKELCAFIGRMDYHEQLYGHLSDASHPVPSYELWLRGPGGHMWVGPKFIDHINILARLTAAFAMDTVVRPVSYLAPPDMDPFLEFIRLFLFSDDDTDANSEPKDLAAPSPGELRGDLVIRTPAVGGMNLLRSSGDKSFEELVARLLSNLSGEQIRRCAVGARPSQRRSLIPHRPMRDRSK